MEKYSLLPFDSRYIETPFEWMEFSFLRYMNKPDPDLVRDYYLDKKYKEKESEKDIEFVTDQLDQYSDFDDEKRKMILETFSKGAN